jgi:hypothetical protein
MVSTTSSSLSTTTTSTSTCQTVRASFIPIRTYADSHLAWVVWMQRQDNYNYEYNYHLK